MRRQRQFQVAKATGLRSLVLLGAVLAQGQLAEAQRSPSNSGDAPKVPLNVEPPGQGVNAGRRVNDGTAVGVAPAAGSNSDQDFRLLIAHGIEMAIEGSTLQGITMRPGGAGSLAAGGVAPPPSTSSSGLGFTGAPGETVSGRPVSTPATGTGSIPPGSTNPGRTALGNPAPGTIAGGPVSGTAVIPLAGGSRPGQPAAGAGTTPAPMAGGSPAAMLQQSASRAFQAGNDLIGQASPTLGPEKNLQQAALIYAATLKSLGAQPAAAPGGLLEGRPVGSPAPSTVGAAELSAIALINHAVKESLGSFRIKQMVGPMGSSGSPAAQQLLSHARQMDDEARSMIQAMNGGPAGQGGAVQALAEQANQLIMAIQALNPEQAGR